MNIIFTICSNNYLAQAKVLTDSAAYYTPGTKIVIGLIDELNPQIDYNYFAPAEFIPINELNLECSEELFSKKNIIELNTSVKPSYFKYLTVKFPSAKKILYFDPDIKIFHSLDIILSELETSDIVLTPHIFSPIAPDDYEPHENLFLKHGIFNLGFIGVKAGEENVMRFLDWWEARILRNCYSNIPGGYFVDQLPINLVPVFFDKVKNLKSLGYNMAPWNLHERSLVKVSEDSYSLNDGDPLYFYHFSSYDHKTPQNICKPYYSRFNFANRPDLVEIYQTYHQNILNNRVSFFETIVCTFLTQQPQLISTLSKKSKLLFWLRQFIPPIIFNWKNQILKK